MNATSTATATENIPGSPSPPVARILRHGMELGPVLAATEPVVRHVIPVFVFGRDRPVEIVQHVLYYLTVPFELDGSGGYVFESERGAWAIDAHVLSGDEDGRWMYACWSRRLAEK